MTEPIRLILADDHGLVRATLSAHLAAEPDLAVVAAVSNADDAVTEALQHRPGVVLLDIDMPGLLCFDAARTIASQCPDTRFIFVSAFFNDRYIEEALGVEASGYVTKDEPPESLVKAIRAAASGSVYFSPSVQARLVVDGDRVRLAHQQKSRISTLTRRELETLRYIARGLSKKEVARIMHIGVKTVDHHSTALMRKLDIHDRVSLARFAIREGLAEP